MTIHLTAQACNSLPYHCHMNVFLTLIPNSTKVKQILKDQPLLELDRIEYKYLFGGEIQGKTTKDYHSKTEVQNNINWTTEKFNISIPSQPQALSSRSSIPKQPIRSTMV